MIKDRFLCLNNLKAKKSAVVIITETAKKPYCAFHINLSHAFLLSTFLFFVISSGYLHSRGKRFYVLRNVTSIGPKKNPEKFPYRPMANYKIAHVWQRHVYA